MKDVLTIIFLFEAIFVLSIICLGSFIGLIKGIISKNNREIREKKKHLKVSEMFENLSSGV